MLLALWSLFCLWFLPGILAERIIRATALVPCMDNSGVQASKFDVTFTPDDRTLSFDISLNVEVSGRVYADLVLYVYGFRAIQERIDPCTTTALEQLCPLTNGEIDIISKTELSQSIVNDIPGVAYTVPNIDCFAIVKVYSNDTNELKACIRAEVTNTKTVEQTSVKWVTAVLSGIGLLVSAVLSYMGSSYTSQKIAATSAMMFSYFQSMSIVNMQACDRVPPIANAWTENVVWSVGLIRVNFMQKIFRWFVQSTGGTPSTYHIYNIISVLVQRSLGRGIKKVPPRVAEFFQFDEREKNLARLQKAGTRIARGLVRRENELTRETYAKSNKLLLVLRGIKRVAYVMGIEDTSIVLTSFTIYVSICVCVAVLFLGIWLLFWTMQKRSRDMTRHQHATQFIPVLPAVLKGTILKLVHFSFPSVILFSMWEWVQQDSAAVIVLSVFFFILTLAIIGWNTFQVWRIAQRSKKETGTPAFLLYSHAPTMHRYGFLYQQFSSNFYFFAIIYLVYHFVVALFIAFSQSSGKTQGLALFLIELIMLILVCVYKPWMDKGLNVSNIIMQVIKTINALLYLFFSNLFTQPPRVNSVMGVIYFVMNAAFSCFLLIYIIVVCILFTIRRDREHGAVQLKDDRMSFIADNMIRQDAAGELMALGEAAGAGHKNSGSWFDSTTATPNLFESPLPEHFRNSQHVSDRTNTMSSVPTFDQLDEEIGRLERTGSQTSFGLASNSPQGSESEKKPSVFKTVKQWWKKDR